MPGLMEDLRILARRLANHGLGDPAQKAHIGARDPRGPARASQGGGYGEGENR
jgi:hypothetical protein